ncbi:hypothetical protein [Nonomuraea fuscirosea]|uniref:hypothetical protein n=1 Tax=Nonomuraea fuscirosea TaxID=1291556 RepID=UPI0034230922
MVGPALAALVRAGPDPVSVATALFGLSLLSPHDDGPGQHDPSRDDGLVRHAEVVAGRLGDGDAPARASALIARLAEADGEHAFPIVGDLLGTVFDRPGARTPHSLTGPRRDALEAVARLGDEPWSRLNLQEVLRHWGVPDGREEPAAFLSR